MRTGGRSPMVSVPIISVLSGLVLATVYAVLQQVGLIKQPFAWGLVFMIGLLVPLAILLADNLAFLVNRRRN
jgi:hypothetical protein